MSSTALTPRVQHVTRVFRAATPIEIEEGAAWYTDANNIASAFAGKYGVTISQAAGVIAAVSPMLGWGTNVNLAGRILAAGGTLTTGGLTKNIAKANRIIAGEDPMAVFATSLKVRNFYLSIITKGADGVTIDRHAYDIAVNKRHTDDTRPGLTPKRYAEAQAVYTRAAEILSEETGVPLTAGQVQSVTWELWRRRFWAKGAFDGHTEI